MQEDANELARLRALITEATVTRSDLLPRLIEEQFDNLMAMAQRLHAREAKGNSLSPASLVNEVYMRLVHQPAVTARDSVFFRACFAQECRRVLVAHARRRNALRRGGGKQRESLDGQPQLGIEGALDVVAMNDVIERLAGLSPRMARIVDMRVFCEMTIEDCAEELGLSPRTVDKDWAFARSYLQKELR